MVKNKYPQLPVLIVDDEQVAIDGSTLILAAIGITNVTGCNDSREVFTRLSTTEVSLILLDLSMPHISGEEILGRLVEEYPHIPVIIVTGLNDLEQAIKCIKTGAFDYMVKPMEETKMVSSIKRALELSDLKAEYNTFKQRVLDNVPEDALAFNPIVTRNAKMVSLFHYTETIAGTTKPVLITGETGVGKELFARAIHELSKCNGPFTAVNVAGLDDHLFADTLFGHTKGSFTGAQGNRDGMIAQARGGTLFLDEIGDIQPASQVKLLRVLQEQEYFPIGSDIPREVQARIVVATNQDLLLLQKKERFRKDLYYRLQTHTIHIPALRERLDDLHLLLEHFLDKAATELKKKSPTPPRELLSLLAVYPFPGNVREFESMVFDAVSHHQGGVLSTGRFKSHIDAQQVGDTRGSDQTPTAMDSAPFTLLENLPTLKEVPHLLIQEAMTRANNNQSVAARLLGITRSGLNKALKRSDQ